jgi:2-keto-4-pentenoate hydratase
MDVARIARQLDEAHRDRRTLEAADVAVADLGTAYAVQRALTALRLGRGDSVIGWKLGYTTAAMREQMGIDAPNYGPLLASMRMEGALAPTTTQPRVEPEIALVIGRDPGAGADADHVLACCAAARLALEVVDSVWTSYRFDLEHNTADGSSAAGVVLGEELPLAAGTVAVVLHVDSQPADGGPSRVEERGEGSLADAARGVAWLAEQLAAEGLALQPGDIVLTGGLTRALALEPGSRATARASGAGVAASVTVSA